MPAAAVDVVVLGAGHVGLGAALNLQARGRSVGILDRLGEVASETSLGNAGIIERQGIFPPAFPRDPIEVLRAALNRDPRAHIHYGALPAIAPFVWRYFLASAPAPRLASAKAIASLLQYCNSEHEALAGPAGSGALLRTGGWIKMFRSSRGRDGAIADAEQVRPFGIAFDVLDREALLALEPHLGPNAFGAVHFTDPLTTSDPQALAKTYADLFVARGGRILRGDARTLSSSAAGWVVTSDAGPVQARDAVVSLGPWSGEFAERLGFSLPFGVKRGYHMHYAPRGEGGLNRPVLDIEKGFVIAPMTRGLRLTTGVEFARRDDPPSSAHLDRVEPFAREMFPIAERRDQAPWLGRRPCFPDMLPVIGAAPGRKGLWFNFGHQHLGLTLGPVSGRLLAQMMTGADTIVDPAPFRADRFS